VGSGGRSVGIAGTTEHTKDQDIIEEDQHETTQEDSQDLIHQRLECGRGVRQSERYDQEFVETVMCTERRLVYVVGKDSDLMIA
jgi:hypothetical protein